MFRLTIDHRPGRKSAPANDVFDLGAGPRNCIDCANLSGPKEELGYACALYVDVISSAEMPTVDVRLEESACGVVARGFSATSAKSFDQCAVGIEGPLNDEAILALVEAEGGDVQYFEPVIGEDPIVAGCGAERTCYWCKHSFMAYFDEFLPEVFCARAVDIESGRPLHVETARGDETLCGPNGAWWQEAPPMIDEEITTLWSGGRTHYHW